MVYEKISERKKKSLASRLNWDYTDSVSDLLDVITGKSAGSNSFSAETLFVRSLETLCWVDLVNLWTIERCIQLYSPRVKRMLRSHFLREEYDRIFSILQGKPLSYAGQDTEHLEKLRESILFDRRNSSKPWLLPA